MYERGGDPAVRRGARVGGRETGLRGALRLLLWAGGLAPLAAACAGDGHRVGERVEATRTLDSLPEDAASLPRYCEILGRMRPDRLTPAERLTRAVFYRRFHRMRAFELYHSLPEAERARCRPLADLEARHGRDADLLWLAFAEAIGVAGEANLDRTQVPEWVLEERERVLGDYFLTRAEQGVLDLTEFAGRAPAALVRELERNCFLQLAVAYYGMGWQRAVSFARPQEASRAAVIRALEALARSAEAIGSLPDRAPEFAADQVILAAGYRDRAESVLSAAGPKEAALAPPSEFAVVDPAHQFGEARQRLSMAISELNVRQGSRAQRFLLDALRHLLFAQELARARTLLRPDVPPSVIDEENARTAADYLGAIFHNVNRITSSKP